jgi:superfamily II DNA/RNA helicase
MERDLNPEWLRLALGEHVNLPSAEEVSRLLSEAEVALLLHKPQISEDLIAIGWYLHAIASSKYAFRTYGFERQRAAFQVAGHIFDLLLQTPELSQQERLKYCFAAQIAYLRSTLDPNALALYRREFAGGLKDLGLLSGFQVALAFGVAFLGFDVGFIFQSSKSLRSEIESLEREWGIDTIFSTPFASAAGVVLGTRDMMSFLVYGKMDLLERAREKLRIAVLSENSAEDHFSRWVAAHLLNLADDLKRASIWTALPPDISPGVRKAFAMGHPKILTLWPPQLDMFNASEQEQSNPLSSQVKRLFLSTPTSSGKTLLAQLLVISHLATEQTSVCYIAPTRSLCWEIRKSLESRMRFLGKEIAAGLPEGDWLDTLFVDFQPEVEVMTPERLSYLIRTDSNRLLEQFGMFIFDEVHLVGEAGRGWTLEEDLTYLHYATQGKDHRIVLMSAAVGNRNHFVEWMSEGESKPFYRHSPWRGPRRLHAIWRTDADWDNSRKEATGSKKYPYRVRYPLYGILNTRISHTGEIRSLKTTKPVGELVYKITQDGEREGDSNNSTPFYKMLIPIIRHLSESGPVLVIEATRPGTVRMAKAIADSLEPIEKPEIRSLVNLVEARLGSEHPLCQVLKKGVAYHHGSLPGEIRTSIEEAVSEGYLKFLVATTTLTEGVNLPVRSVVIASQGTHSAEGYVEYITGSKLINAIGRAGRATKETEGIVVLARPAAPDPADFKRLDPDDSDIRISSMLATEKALNALAAFEELQRTSEDAVFQTAKGEVSDFLTFVWFVAAELEKMGKSPTQEQVQEVLGHSLAWVQLESEDKERWLAAAGSALVLYQEADTSVRRRWAVAGTAISSAAKMESIARELAAILQNSKVLQDPAEVVDLIIGGGRLQRILQLPEAPARRAHTQRGGRSREEIAIPMEALLHDWLQGSDLVTLADTYFNATTDMDFRFEQLGDFIYDYFEIFFPRVFGTIVGWTNSFLEELGAVNLLPKTIAANVRWGVSNSTALELMVRGIQSRSLALRVARAWQSEEREGAIHSWIRSMSISDWQRIFEAAPAELRSILEFSRDRRGGVAVDLIAQGIAEFEVASNFTEFAQNEAFLVPVDDSDLPSVDICVGEEVVGRILSRDQADVRNLLSVGLILSIKFSASSGRGLLNLKLVEPEA